MSQAGAPRNTAGRHGGATDHNVWLVVATFVGEIALFSALGLAALTWVGQGAPGVVAAVTVVLVVLWLFSLFMAHGSPRRLPDVARVVVLAALGATAVAIHALVGFSLWAWIAAIATLVLLGCVWWSRGQAPIEQHHGRHAR